PLQPPTAAEVRHPIVFRGSPCWPSSVTDLTSEVSLCLRNSPGNGSKHSWAKMVIDANRDCSRVMADALGRNGAATGRANFQGNRRFSAPGSAPKFSDTASARYGQS